MQQCKPHKSPPPPPKNSSKPALFGPAALSSPAVHKSLLREPSLQAKGLVKLLVAGTRKNTPS